MLRSSELFETAQQFIPGGVNSPVRAFKGVGGTPIFFNRAQGALLFDEDDQEYIDYVGSWGPMILGHQDPSVIQAIQAALAKGVSFGAPTQAEVQLAKIVCELIPSVEQIRMVNSGTEATMTALRLARGYTGRDLIIKFEGCYHGHSDSLLIKAGSGALTFGQPSSPGVPADLAKHTLNLSFNDSEGIIQAFKQYGDRVAGVIVEPVAGNMGCILPEPAFLHTLREVCDQSGALLIFDEVMTGFRVALGGAQAYYQITPDLTTFGKIIGGGLPVGALGGKKTIMSHLSPVGPVYQAGTLSGNPLAMAAGIATLTKIQSLPDFYPRLNKITEDLAQGLMKLAQKHHIALQVNYITGMFTPFFTKQKQVSTFSEVMQCDTEKFSRFYHGMLKEGVYFGPSAFEAAFVSIVHDTPCIEKTLAAADRVFSTLAE